MCPGRDWKSGAHSSLPRLADLIAQPALTTKSASRAPHFEQLGRHAVTGGLPGGRVTFKSLGELS
jgi:hypothetical protein